MIKVEHLVGGYDNTPIIHGLDFEIKRGEFFVLLGPNGSGKTTLFKLITGQLPILEGKISIAGTPFSTLSKKEKAKKMAVLTQEVQVSFDYTVEEIISLGRYPYQTGMLKRLSREDCSIIEEVMEITNVSQFRSKQFRMLSGGEKQRVLLAKALAQEPEILLLDEPTNHLDIKHTFQMLNLLKERQRTMDLTVFAIVHDLNIAALYADRVALLHNGSFLDVGDVETLRKEDQLKKVYEVEVTTQAHPTIPRPQLLMTPTLQPLTSDSQFPESLKVVKNDEYIHIESSEPMRTISNGVIGDGIGWNKHFCNFHVDKNYDCADPIFDIKTRMLKQHIPSEQAVGMLTAVYLEDVVICLEQIEGVELMVIVTAGVGNAVDITQGLHSTILGTINTMIFLDAHFTDGALVNGSLSATEAKVKALHDQEVKDPLSGTLATGTSTDSLLLALTQKGERTPYAGSGTKVGKAIGQLVYKATFEAIEKNKTRSSRQRKGE